jgi:hypothetical protein
MIFIIDELKPEVMNFFVDVLKRKSITTVVRLPQHFFQRGERNATRTDSNSNSNSAARID